MSYLLQGLLLQYYHSTMDTSENNVPIERLISFARRLKEGTGKPVTFNEGVYEWEHLKQLADELDIISIP